MKILKKNITYARERKGSSCSRGEGAYVEEVRSSFEGEFFVPVFSHIRSDGGVLLLEWGETRRRKLLFSDEKMSEALVPNGHWFFYPGRIFFALSPHHDVTRIHSIGDQIQVHLHSLECPLQYVPAWLGASMADTSMTGGTAVAEEWQSGRGSLARQVSQGQGDSYFSPHPLVFQIFHRYWKG